MRLQLFFTPSYSPSRRGRRYQRGLTVLELIVGLSIGSILLAALLRFLVAGYPLSRITLLQANSNETARNTLNRIGREIRSTRLSDSGAYPLVAMLPQRIIFYADIDADPDTERVRYELSGTNLERGIINPTGDPVIYNELEEEVTIVTRHIQNGSDPIFTYYKGSYPADPVPLTPVDLTEVKYIQFLLRIDADTDIDPPPIDVRSQVQLRNLKTNLGDL